MKAYLHIACALCLLMQTGIAQALPPCPESGYFHNCFGTRTYVIEARATGAWAALEKEIELAKKEKSIEEVTQSNPPEQKFNKYVGEFKEDMRDGFGIFSENGIDYEGNWKNDKKNGQGIYSAVGGFFVFSGEFKDNKRFGSGQLLLSNGDIYVGEFDDEISNKYRVLAFNDIVTEWFDSGINGQGVMIYADGRISLGEWKYGTPHGLFIEYASDKKIVNSGIYMRGKLRETHDIYAEAFPSLNILPTCQGIDVKTWSNCVGNVASSNEAGQSSYYGEFQNGSFNGRGKYFYETKGVNPVSGVYRGEFKEGRFHGLGVHSFEDEKFKVQIGEWREGKSHRFFLDVAPAQENQSRSYHLFTNQ